MKQPESVSNQHGLTLVELMIAMALSLLLMAGATSMFLGSKKTFKVQEESARIQENARYIVTRMTTDISPAGFYGCAPSAQKGTSQVYSTIAATNPFFDFSEAVTGTEGSGPNNSDSLTVRFALPEISLPVIKTSTNRAIYVDSSHPAYSELSEGDIVAVSDCSFLTVFMITNTPGDDGRLAHTAEAGTTHYFGKTPYSSVMKMDAVTYDLGTTTNDQNTTTTDDDTTVSSLYATRLGGNRQQILSGVEDFQVSYGIDSTEPPDGTSDRYINWDAVTNDLRSRIASLRITLTINSGKPIPVANDANQDFTENIEFVVKLRNRLANL